MTDKRTPEPDVEIDSPSEIETDSPEEDDTRDLEIEEELDLITDDDVDGALEPPEPVDIDAIEEEARRSTTLVGRLKGIKHRTRKVLLFTDPDAAQALAQTNAMIQRLADAIGELGQLSDRASEEEVVLYGMRRDALTEQMTNLEEQLEPIKRQALEGALAVHLVGYPAIAVKVARRAAIKRFLDPATKRIPTEDQDEFSNFVENFLLGASVLKIVDSNGNQLELPKRSEIGQTLEEMLPAPQWERLKLNFMQLNVEDQVSQAVQDDAGF